MHTMTAAQVFCGRAGEPEPFVHPMLSTAWPSQLRNYHRKISIVGPLPLLAHWPMLALEVITQSPAIVVLWLTQDQPLCPTRQS